MLVSIVPMQVASASDTSTRWVSFSESTGCGSPFTRGPMVSRIGSLSNSEPILGPYGSYFGRSIADVRSRLVWWTVPNSGGKRVQVHEAMYPSMVEVADALAVHAAQGRVYPIKTVGAFVPRTIAGRHQVSRHGLGLAIDFNFAQNPYRSDNKLVTDMPQWFIDTWTDAGFCWGGYWQSVKDPMHFSWMGPGATPDSSDTITPLAPLTSKADFEEADNYVSEHAAVANRYQMILYDANSNGTSDIAGVRSHTGGSVVDIASGTYSFGECSVWRWFIEDSTAHAADHIVFGDFTGDSGLDMVALTDDGSSMDAEFATRVNVFEDLVAYGTSLSSDAVDVTAADFNSDHRADLWELLPGGTLRVWSGDQFADKIHETTLPGSPIQIAAGDRDGGDRAELFALYGGPQARVDVFEFSGGWSLETSLDLPAASGVADLAAADYDGDGRADIQILSNGGGMTAYIGNTSTGVPADRWFTNPDQDCDNPLLLQFGGSFYDDDGNIFEANIESIADVGVTKGCNPPFNDRFCPDDVVTRETMAAFLVRALGLTLNTHPGFVDVDPDSTFAEDIGRLATAGITRGCNPPENDQFCPDDPVTRETMAAFMVRALGLVDGSHPGFVDVASNSIFREDIRRLAAAGITRGCNPPTNDMFCPKDVVVRDTMAAFLDRAGLGS